MTLDYKYLAKINDSYFGFIRDDDYLVIYDRCYKYWKKKDKVVIFDHGLSASIYIYTEGATIAHWGCMLQYHITII